MYFTLKSSKTSMKLIGRHACFQNPGVYLNWVYLCCASRCLSTCGDRMPACGSPYTHFHHSTYKKHYGVAIYQSLYRSMIPSGISAILSRRYSKRVKGVFRYKILIYNVMNFGFSVEITMLSMSFMVSRSVVSIPQSSG